MTTSSALALWVAAAAPMSAIAAEVPTLAQLEASGARIGEVRIEAGNIFDLDDPHENNALFRLANALHVGTRPEVIRRELLFKTGDLVSARVIEETERILHANRYLYEVTIVPVNYRDGVVDIEVRTRDTWTINLTGKYSRSGGANSSKFGIRDTNVAGRALTLGFSQTSDPDRKGSEFEADYRQAFDGRTRLAYLQGNYDDGSSRVATIERPFYALDTRWAYAATWERFDRVDSIYNAGDVASAYRHASDGGVLSIGWSPGLVNGWVQRYSLGITAREDSYSLAPGEVAPARLPADHKVRGPFVRHEVVQDRFVRTRNREQIARTEFAEMGFHSRVQLARALEGWGSTRPAWLYSVAVSDGLSMANGHDVHATLTAERQVASQGEPLDHQGILVRYFGPQGPRAAFYGSLALDRVGKGAAAPDLLAIGGDSGLRGYPLRYQHGEQRALLTLEQRYYTDWYLFRLVRVGGAAFIDAGRAWRGVNQNAINGGWLGDAGIGLRLALDRTAFANVLHIDAAVPFDREPGIKAVELVVKTQLTF